VTIPSLGQLDSERASWNDDMYAAHPTPYARGLARHIELARVRTVVAFAAIRPSDAVIEIGCEAGNLLAALPPARRIVGVDISLRALADAQRRFASLRRTVELFQVDAERGLPFAQGEFDVILCSEMLEHTSDPGAVIRHIHGVATPQTRVIISVPHERPKVRLKELLHRLGLLRLVGDVEPHRSEWHTQEFSPSMLNALLGPLFVIERARMVWATHYVVSLRPR